MIMGGYRLILPINSALSSIFIDSHIEHIVDKNFNSYKMKL